MKWSILFILILILIFLLVFKKKMEVETKPKGLKRLTDKMIPGQVYTSEMNPSIGWFFPRVEGGGTKFQMDQEAMYSTTSPYQFDMVKKMLETHKIDVKNMIITDATASVGGSSIGFSKLCKHVNTVEINPKTFNMLKNNINLYPIDNISLYNEDYTKIMKELKQDMVLLDAPWGGMGYKQKSEISLSLSGIDLSEICNELYDYTEYILLKVPKNYEFSKFSKKCKFPRIHLDSLKSFNIILCSKKVI